jgi:hypothetical protein
MGKKSVLSPECQKFAFFSKEKATKKPIFSFDSEQVHYTCRKCWPQSVDKLEVCITLQIACSLITDTKKSSIQHPWAVLLFNYWFTCLLEIKFFIISSISLNCKQFAKLYILLICQQIAVNTFYKCNEFPVNSFDPAFYLIYSPFLT